MGEQRGTQGWVHPQGPLLSLLDPTFIGRRFQKLWRRYWCRDLRESSPWFKQHLPALFVEVPATSALSPIRTLLPLQAQALCSACMCGSVWMLLRRKHHSGFYDFNLFILLRLGHSP